MSVSNLYATTPISGVKYIKQDKIEVDNLIVDESLVVNGPTVYDGGVVINGRDNANVELVMNFDANALACIGSTTGMNFETLDENLGAVICENSSATAGSTVSSKISIKPAIWDGANPVISDMLSVGKDLLTTEVGVFAKTCFGAGLSGNLGITNIEDYVATSTGKVYRFNMPPVGAPNENLSLVADQIAPSGGAGSPPSVVSTKVVLAVKPVGPASAPTKYDLYLGDSSTDTPNVLVEGTAGNGQVYDTLYNPVSRNYFNIFPTTGGIIAITGSGTPITQTYTPARSGLYAFNICIELSGASTIGSDNIEYTFQGIYAFSPFAGTIKPSDISPFVAGRNNTYNFTNIGYLTGGQTYTCSLTPYGNATGPNSWNVGAVVSYAPFC